MHGLLEQRWLATASYGAALWGRCAQHSPHPRDYAPEAARPRLRARAKDRSLDRKLLSLRGDPEKYSTLLCPLVTCNHSWIRQEMACYKHAVWPATTIYVRETGRSYAHRMLLYQAKELLSPQTQNSSCTQVERAFKRLCAPLTGTSSWP